MDGVLYGKKRRRLSPKDKAVNAIINGDDETGFKKVFIDSEIGYGVIAECNFAKGDFLLVYKGDFITSKEAAQREIIYKRQKLGCFMYYFSSQEHEMCIDATHSNGMGRLCNDELKDPNAVMKKIFTDRDHLCVFALKNIVCGEEIRYNYGPDDGSMYWRYKPKPAKICQARRESGTEAEHKTTLLVTAEDKLLVCQTSVTDVDQALRESGTEAEHEVTLIVSAEDELLVGQTPVTGVDHALRESGTEAEHEATLTVTTGDKLLVCQTSVADVDQALRESGTEAEHENTLLVTAEDELLVGQTPITDVDQALRESGTEAEHEATLTVTAGDKLPVCQTTKSIDSVQHSTVVVLAQQTANAAKVDWYSKEEVVTCAEVGVIGLKTNVVLKFEDIRKKYRPQIAHFDSTESGIVGKLPWMNRKLKDKYLMKHKKQTGYCECCEIHYDYFKTHVASFSHRMFALTTENYKKVDCLISELPTLDQLRSSFDTVSKDTAALTVTAEDKLLVGQTPVTDVDHALRESGTEAEHEATLIVSAEDKLLIGQTPVTDVDHALRESGTEAEHEATLIVSAEDKLLIGQTPVTDVDQALRESGTEAEHEATLIVSAEDKLLVCQTSVTGVDHVLRESGTEAEHEATLSVSAEDKLTVCQTPVTDVDPACPQSGVITSIRLVDYSDSSQMSDCCAEMQTVTCFTNMDYVDDSHSSWIEINVITDDVTTSCSAKFLNFQQFLDVCRPDEQTSVSRFSSNCLDTLQDSEYAEIIDIERGDEEKELSEVQCSRTNELAGPVDFLGIIADSNDFSRNNPVPESSTQKEQTVSNGNLNKCRSIDFSSHRAENCKQSVTDNCDFEFDDEVWDTDLRGNHRSLRNKAYSIDLRPSGRDDGEFEVEIMNSCDEFSGVSNNDDQEFEVGNLNIGEEEGSESSEDSDDVRKTLNKSSNVNIVARRPSISNDNKKNCSVSLFSKKSSKPGKKQAYDKVHVCFFCNKELKCKMKRHILSVHRKEDVVQNILLLPKGIERTNMVNRLINEGNFKHNIEVIQRGEGQLVVGKRFGSTKKPSAYTACSFCKKFQSKKNLWRHNKTCPERIAYYSRHSDTNNGQNKRILAVKRGQALVNAAAFSSEDCNLSDLTDRMRDDDIKEICLADSLVRKEAELRLQGLGKKEDQKTDDIYRVSQAARLLGRIILQARETKPGITMSELIVPANFDFTVKVAKMLSTDKDKPALNVAKSIGFSLLKVCDTKYCQGLRDTDYQAQTDASDFKKLIETEWNLRVNRTALRCIQKEKRSKVEPIPLTEDLQKFRNYLLIQIRDLSEQLKRQCDAKTWVKLAKCTMSRLILFNKRRRAEVRELKVDEYINRPNWKDDVNGEMGKALTPTDRLLANRMDMVVNAGKSRKNVEAFVLLPPDSRRAVDLLNDMRSKVGVPLSNPYVFGRLLADTPMAGHTEMQELAQQCDGLDYPERITSRKLRTYIATVSQILDMNNTELEQLARHLGHDPKTHKDFYRLSHSTVQLSKVARLLMACEQGTLHQYGGKSLDEIQPDDLPDIEDIDEVEDGSIETRTVATATACRPRETPPISKSTRAKKRKQNVDSEYEPSDTVTQEVEAVSKLRRPISKCSRAKKRNQNVDSEYEPSDTETQEVEDVSELRRPISKCSRAKKRNQNVDSEYEPSDTETQEVEDVSKSKRPISKCSRAKKRNQNVDSEYEPSDTETQEVEDVSELRRPISKCSRAKKRNQNVDSEYEPSDTETQEVEAVSKLKRPRWSASELSKLFETFGAHITHKKYPSGKQLAEFAREINSSRTVPTIRAQLHNIINGKVKCQNTH